MIGRKFHLTTFNRYIFCWLGHFKVSFYYPHPIYRAGGQYTPCTLLYDHRYRYIFKFHKTFVMIMSRVTKCWNKNQPKIFQKLPIRQLQYFYSLSHLIIKQLKSHQIFGLLLRDNSYHIAFKQPNLVTLYSRGNQLWI